MEIETVSLIDLAEYQDGSIVCRELIGKETGTVTLFAFAEGQGFSEHAELYDALIYILEGESEISISGSPRIVKEGEMIIIPSRKSHAVKAKKRFKMLRVLIKY
jgi:quercetin dioxygenase-like cupin family protein